MKKRSIFTYLVLTVLVTLAFFVNSLKPSTTPSRLYFSHNFGSIILIGSEDGNSFYDLTLGDNSDVYLTGYTSGASTLRSFFFAHYPTNSDDLLIKAYKSEFLTKGRGISYGNKSVYIIGTAVEQDEYFSFVTKLNSSGYPLWFKRFRFFGTSHVWSHGVEYFDSDEIYILGELYHWDMNIASEFIARIDDKGNFRWSKMIYSSKARYIDINDLSIGTDGSIYVVGEIKLNNKNDTDLIIAKLEKTGTISFVKILDFGSYETGYGLVTDTLGNIYIVGTVLDTTIYSEDGLVVKLNSTGEVEWSLIIYRESKNEHFSSIDIKPPNRLYICGTYDNNGLIGSLSVNGSVIWFKSIGEEQNTGMINFEKIAISKEYLFVGGLFYTDILDANALFLRVNITNLDRIDEGGFIWEKTVPFSFIISSINFSLVNPYYQIRDFELDSFNLYPDTRDLKINIDTLLLIKNQGYLDSDRDGMPDYWEKHFGLNIFNASDGNRDLDSDGLSNKYEYRFGTNPLKSDSDGDMFSDLLEIATLSDPLNILYIPLINICILITTIIVIYDLIKKLVSKRSNSK